MRHERGTGANGVKRYRAAAIVNLVLPGAGLILLRREWLGLAAAMLFGLCVEVGLFGRLVAPAVVPVWAQEAAWGAAGVIWVAAQMLVRARLGFLTDPEFPEQLAGLRQRAIAAIEADALEEARGLLRVAMALDDEDADVQRCWGRLLEAQGMRQEARRARQRASKLDRRGGLADDHEGGPAARDAIADTNGRARRSSEGRRGDSRSGGHRSC